VRGRSDQQGKDGETEQDNKSGRRNVPPPQPPRAERQGGDRHGEHESAATAIDQRAAVTDRVGSPDPGAPKTDQPAAGAQRDRDELIQTTWPTSATPPSPVNSRWRRCRIQSSRSTPPGPLPSSRSLHHSQVCSRASAGRARARSPPAFRQRDWSERSRDRRGAGLTLLHPSAGVPRSHRLARPAGIDRHIHQTRVRTEWFCAPGLRLDKVRSLQE